MSRAIAMVWNPISGKGRGKRLAEEARPFLDAHATRLTTLETRASGDARGFAARVAGDHDVILSLGGDGTLNEVVNGVCLDRPDLSPETRPCLLPLRAGTSNVMAMELGISAHLPNALSLLDSGVRVLADRGVINGHRSFLLWTGVGIDGEIVRRTMEHRTGPINKFTYFSPIVSTLRSFDLPRLAVSVDGRELEGDFSQVWVANARMYAAFLRLCPDASVTGGSMAVIGLRSRSKLGLFAPFLRSLFGGLEESSSVHIHHGRRIRISAKAGVAPVQIDGDFAGVEPVDIEVIPSDVPLLVPADRAAQLGVCVTGASS